MRRKELMTMKEFEGRKEIDNKKVFTIRIGMLGESKSSPKFSLGLGDMMSS